MPLGDKFSLFARAGLNYADAKDSFAGTGSVAVIDPSPQQMGRQLQIRIRRRNMISPASVGMRIEAERYRIDDAVGNKGDIDLYSAGLVFKFGRTEPPPPPAPSCVAAPVAEPRSNRRRRLRPRLRRRRQSGSE